MSERKVCSCSGSGYSLRAIANLIGNSDLRLADIIIVLLGYRIAAKGKFAVCFKLILILRSGNLLKMLLQCKDCLLLGCIIYNFERKSLEVCSYHRTAKGLLDGELALVCYALCILKCSAVSIQFLAEYTIFKFSVIGYSTRNLNTACCGIYRGHLNRSIDRLRGIQFIISGSAC